MSTSFADGPAVNLRFANPLVNGPRRWCKRARRKDEAKVGARAQQASRERG
jgi:hypothetical protein